VSKALKPCPFCGVECTGYPVGDALSVEGDHDVLCPFHHDDPIISAEAWNTRAQPSDGALTNEGAGPVVLPDVLALTDARCPRHHLIADGFRAGADWMRREVAKLGPLYRRPPAPAAPAAVVLPVRAAAYGNRLQEWHTTGWNACLDRVKELNS
jgi:hypothetical protein